MKMVRIKTHNWFLFLVFLESLQAIQVASNVTITSSALSTPTTCATSPQCSYSAFEYTQITLNITAVPLPASATGYKPTFAPAFTENSTLLPRNASYTTWSLNKSATLTFDGPYGQSGMRLSGRRFPTRIHHHSRR